MLSESGGEFPFVRSTIAFPGSHVLPANFREAGHDTEQCRQSGPRGRDSRSRHRRRARRVLGVTVSVWRLDPDDDQDGQADDADHQPHQPVPRWPTVVIHVRLVHR